MEHTALKNYVEGNMPGSLTYAEYRELVTKLHDEGKVTGHEQSESLLEYSKLNEHRMNRWDKHFKVQEDFATDFSLPKGKFYWLVITEGWCGDSAQVLPGIVKIAELFPQIELKVVLRDDYPDLMNEVLTNGKKAIPILVCLNEEGDFLWKWGPRPAIADELVQSHKLKADYDAEEMKKDLHLWYARNAQLVVLEELKEVLKNWLAVVK